MTERQRIFSEHYAAHGNAARAAREAGYSQGSARQQGAKLLTNPDICNYVNSLRQTAKSEAVADAAEIQGICSAILRDSTARNADRLKAGALLMQWSTAQTAAQAQDASDEGTGLGAVIVEPYIPGSNQRINAFQQADGSVIPAIGAENDDVLIFLQYNCTASAYETQKE